MSPHRLAIAIAALTLAPACGKKPKAPTPGPPPTSASSLSATSAGPGPGPGPSAPTTMTAGGTDLTGLSKELSAIAVQIATRPEPATRALIAAGTAASTLVKRLLASQNLRELEAAAHFYAAHPAEEAVPRLVELASHAAAAVRAAALDALGHQPGPAAGAALVGLLGATDAATRANAARALVGHPDAAGATAPLLKLLGAGGPDEVAEATLALSARKTEPPTAKALMEIAVTSKAHQRKGALAVIRRLDLEIGTKGRTMMLAQAVRSADPGVALEAARHINRLPDKERATLVASALENTAVPLRGRLIEVLAELPKGHASARDLATRVLADGEGPDAITALRVLSSLTPASQREALIAPALAATSTGLRRAGAVIAAGDLPAERAAALISARLDHERDEVTREHLLYVLAELPGRDGPAAVIEQLGDNDLGGAAWLALRTATGLDHGRDSQRWRGWLDKARPKAPQPASAPSPTPGDPAVKP